MARLRHDSASARELRPERLRCVGLASDKTGCDEEQIAFQCLLSTSFRSSIFTFTVTMLRSFPFFPVMYSFTVVS